MTVVHTYFYVIACFVCREFNHALRSVFEKAEIGITHFKSIILCLIYRYTTDTRL